MADKQYTPNKALMDSRISNSEDLDYNKKHIQVSCRFKPLCGKDYEKINSELLPDSKTVRLKSVCDNSNQLTFSFDKVFGVESSQKEIYEEVGKPIVESVIEGFNGTVLAYGQTSSGKTYTMIGPDINDNKTKGIVPRMVKTIFEQIREADTVLEFAVKISYCEIYLEKIRDLLYSSSKTNLKVAEDKTKGVYIRDLSEIYVTSEPEVFELLRIGNRHREVGATCMNEESSRSHAIFMVTVSQNNTNDLSVKTGKLYLVDLAGSEKLAKSCAEGKRLDETKNINKSLSALGNVICALTDGKSTHVPYRDSKLTRVLSESLGGNSKTSLIVTVSSHINNEAETISTLRFGLRAKCVKNKPIVNKELSIAELKLMITQANDNILKKNTQIQWLQQKLRENSGLCSEAAEIENNIDGVCALSQYGDIMDELQKEKDKVKDLNTTIQEYIKDIKGFSNKNCSLERENDELNMKIANLVRVVQGYEDKIVDLNESCNELKVKKDAQEKQILCLLDTNKNLDRKIEEMQIIISDLLAEQEVVEDYWKYFKENSDKCKALNAEISKLQNTNKDFFPTKNLLKEIIHNQDSILSLLVFTEKSSKLNSSNPRSIEHTEESSKNKVFSLEKNLEQLNLMYQILSNKYTAAKTDLSIYEKKIIRKNDRILQLEKALKKSTDQANQFKYKYENAAKELPDKSLEISQVRSQHPKIKKMIKGGGNICSINILCPYSMNTE